MAATALRVSLILVAMQIAGIQMTIFAAVIAGSYGCGCRTGFSGTLQNFASGVLIPFLKPFQAGDNILAQGQEGTVSPIRIILHDCIVTTFDNKIIIIPNSKCSNEIIVNTSALIEETIKTRAIYCRNLNGE